MFLDLATVLQGLFISLGVGASTVAVVNFFVAIWDGKIDQNERKMMGVTYKILRIAMIMILLSTLLNSMLRFVSEIGYFVFDYAVWSLVLLLFVNAFLMTQHLLPSAFGPAIQASAWYTLGIISTFRYVGWEISYLQFMFLYFVIFSLAVSLINLLLIHAKNLQTKS